MVIIILICILITMIPSSWWLELTTSGKLRLGQEAKVYKRLLPRYAALNVSAAFEYSVDQGLIATRREAGLEREKVYSLRDLDAATARNMERGTAYLLADGTAAFLVAVRNEASDKLLLDRIVVGERGKGFIASADPSSQLFYQVDQLALRDHLPSYDTADTTVAVGNDLSIAWLKILRVGSKDISYAISAWAAGSDKLITFNLPDRTRLQLRGGYDWTTHRLVVKTIRIGKKGYHHADKFEWYEKAQSRTAIDLADYRK